MAGKCEPLLKEQIESRKLTTLQDVNGFFAAWLERRYHDRRHGVLKMSPRQALENPGRTTGTCRQVEAATVRQAFLWRENREVSPLGAVEICFNPYRICETVHRLWRYGLRRIDAHALL